jgi:hypothetical protein
MPNSRIGGRSDSASARKPLALMRVANRIWRPVNPAARPPRNSPATPNTNQARFARAGSPRTALRNRCAPPCPRCPQSACVANSGTADRKDKPAFCEVLAALDCICWGEWSEVFGLEWLCAPRRPPYGRRRDGSRGHILPVRPRPELPPPWRRRGGSESANL